METLEKRTYNFIDLEPYKDEIIESYEGGKTAKEIGEQFGVSTSVIIRSLKEWNIDIRTKFIDLTGPTINGLEFIKFIGTNKDRASIWEVKCSCGNIFQARASHIKRGSTKSCGCYKIKLWREISRNSGKSGKYITGQEFSSIRNIAKTREIEFNITFEDIENLYEKQNKKCALTGRELAFNNGQINGKRIYGNASVDRIDSNLGYTIDNIQIVHKDINIVKRCLSQQDFIKLCQEVIDYQKLV